MKIDFPSIKIKSFWLLLVLVLFSIGAVKYMVSLCVG